MINLFVRYSLISDLDFCNRSDGASLLFGSKLKLIGALLSEYHKKQFLLI